jgi:hypothetical protein
MGIMAGFLSFCLFVAPGHLTSSNAVKLAHAMQLHMALLALANSSRIYLACFSNPHREEEEGNTTNTVLLKARPSSSLPPSLPPSYAHGQQGASTHSSQGISPYSPSLPPSPLPPSLPP